MVEKKEFTGRLAEPIKVDGSGCGMVELIEKLPLLFEHYGIENREDGSSWGLLAVKLAMDLVPGLQLEHVDKRFGRGRKKDDPKELLMLVVDVSRLVDERGLSVSSAARTLAKRRGSRWHKQASGTLKNKFRRAVRDRRVWSLLHYMNQKSRSTEIE